MHMQRYVMFRGSMSDTSLLRAQATSYDMVYKFKQAWPLTIESWAQIYKVAMRLDA